MSIPHSIFYLPDMVVDLVQRTLLPTSRRCNNYWTQICGTTIDAYAAVVQDIAERSNLGATFCLFSSWIPAIAAGRICDGGLEGTIQEHVRVTWPTVELGSLHGRLRRGIPLCGGDPPHWVLGWIDYTRGQYGIVDSLPDIHSRQWAEQYLCTAVNAIRSCLVLPQLAWDAYSFTVIAPSEAERQWDSWSCGLFVMTAIQHLADDWAPPLLGDSAKEYVRAGALKSLLGAPLRGIIPKAARSSPAKSSQEQSSSRASREPALEADDQPANLYAAGYPTSDAGSTQDRKHKRTVSIDSSDVNHSAPTLTKKTRGKRLTETQRRAALQTEQWTAAVEAHRVRCGGCESWIVLRTDRTYDHCNWDKHAAKCPRITGVAFQRVAITPAAKTMFSYFQSTALPPTRMPPRPTDSKSKQTARPGVKYKTRKVTVGRILKNCEHTSLPTVNPIPFADSSDPPANGNVKLEERLWTLPEQHYFDNTLKGYAVWEVDFPNRCVKSKACMGTTANTSGVCDECSKLVETNQGFQKAMYHTKKEAAMTEDEQREKHLAREKYAPLALRALEARELQARMAGPFIFRVWKLMEHNQCTETFIALYEQARNGKLDDQESFRSICEVMAEQVHRATDPNMKLKHGMRYLREYMNFMVLMRSYGQKSAQQYSILRGALGGPCPRAMRYFVKKSPDCLTDPDLTLKNVARVKRVVDALKYTGPVALAGDCTKVRKMLTYSNDFGSHVLGAVLPLNGSGYKQHQRLCSMQKSEEPPLAYDYPLYEVRLRAPVFANTGPLISVQDPPHARKTCRNQPQHGTHTASMGKGFIVNRSFIQLYETQIPGLQLRDVQDVDKQDDGAARRMFHPMALSATTTENLDGSREIRPEFLGLFVYLFIFGILSPPLMQSNQSDRLTRVLAALRAWFFLHIWAHHVRTMSRRFPALYHMDRSFISSASFHIFNRLCDTLVLLVIAYSRHYPNQPFCPWLLGTEFVEHFFGLAHSLLPDFTYTELLKLVKHVMLRQHILLTGGIQARKEQASRSGYILDYDPAPLTDEELAQSRVSMPDHVLNELVVLAFEEASQISKQLLFMLIPSRPLTLQALGTPPPSSQSISHMDADDGVNDHDDFDPAAQPEEDNIENENDIDGEDGDNINTETSEESPLKDNHTTECAANVARYAARYAALSEDYESTLLELPDEPTPVKFPAPALTPPVKQTAGPAHQPLVSEILDTNKKVSVAAIVSLREKHQSGTSTRSERVIAIDQKFALGRLLNPEKNIMSIRQVSHHLRVFQALTIGGRQEKTICKLRWQTAAKEMQVTVSDKDLPNIVSKNVNTLNPLRPGSCVIMHSSTKSALLYVGEILDLYKYASRRHGSIDSAAGLSCLSYLSLRVYLPMTVGRPSIQKQGSPDHNSENSGHESDTSSESEDDWTTYFSRCCGGSDLFTHGFAHELLYHLGPRMMEGPPTACSLKPWAAARWSILRKFKFANAKGTAPKGSGWGARAALPMKYYAM
ncbi:hypothetical protein C2E23DRAFT_859281 [Lenzites betulinus]|nr:hypothetical protein C2E23DRAFT_859281 [Lenzites betulinus]